MVVHWDTSGAKYVSSARPEPCLGQYYCTVMADALFELLLDRHSAAGFAYLLASCQWLQAPHRALAWCWSARLPSSAEAALVVVAHNTRCRSRDGRAEC